MRVLDDAVTGLEGGGDSRAILAKLRGYLLGLPKGVASELIRKFLDGKRDAGTRLEFAVERNGFLAGAPSLRVFLLDMLAQVDPAGAGEYAKVILGSADSPDEWAVCLRNYARYDGSAQGVAYVEGKLAEMLGNAGWAKEASVGYLEAFDGIVYTHDTELTPTLTALVSGTDNRAVAHAAYLALDRLAIEDPTPVLRQLVGQPQLMQGHELTRADYVARADVTDATQRGLVESYLLDPNRSQAELNAFASIYPNENYMISNNLLTQTVTPTGAEIAQRDRAALAVVQGWAADARFAGVLPEIQKMETRLQTFVNEENAQAGK
jgi:hypothetical protein